MEFFVNQRNPGHWDIHSDGARIFRIRGGPGKYWVGDERPTGEDKGGKHFNTVSACMAYICDELMFELIVVEGQKPIIIESWNV